MKHKYHLLPSRLMTALLTLAVISGHASATTDTNPLNADNWVITSSPVVDYTMTASGGTDAAKNYSVHLPRIPGSRPPAGPAYIGGVYSSCTGTMTASNTFQVTWNGVGAAPSYVCVAINTSATIADGASDAGFSLDDGFKDPVTTLVPSVDDVAAGATVKYSMGGTHYKTLKLSGGSASYSLTTTATCSGSTLQPSSSHKCFAAVAAGCSLTVVSKGLWIKGSNDDSYHRVAGPPVDRVVSRPAVSWSSNVGDSAVLNHGLAWADWNCDISFNAQRIGNWSGNYKAFPWSTITNYNWSNDDPHSITNFDTDYYHVVFDYTLDQVLGLADGPQTKTIKLTATDDTDGFTADASYTLTVHGPVELAGTVVSSPTLLGWADKLASGASGGSQTIVAGDYTWTQASSNQFTQKFAASLSGEVSTDTTAYKIISLKFKADMDTSILVTETTQTTISDVFHVPVLWSGSYLILVWGKPKQITYGLFGDNGYNSDAVSSLTVPYATQAWKPVWVSGTLPPSLPSPPPYL